MEYAQNYAKMSDDELTRIYADRASLVPEAIQAIEVELARRSLTVGDRQEQPLSLTRSATVSAPGRGAHWGKGWFGYLALALVVRMLVTAYFQRPQPDNSPVTQFVAEMNANAAANGEFRVKLREILKRRLDGFAEFQQQMNDLEVLLNSGEPRFRRGMDLFRQVRKDFPPEATSSLPLFDRLFEDDSKMFAIEREEIACSKALARNPTKARVRFQAICQVPAYDKLNPLADDENSITHELQKQGVKLPADVQ
jgi:hypothetical protein